LRYIARLFQFFFLFSYGHIASHDLRARKFLMKYKAEEFFFIRFLHIFLRGLLLFLNHTTLINVGGHRKAVIESCF